MIISANNLSQVPIFITTNTPFQYDQAKQNRKTSLTKTHFSIHNDPQNNNQNQNSTQHHLHSKHILMSRQTTAQ